MVNRQQLSSSFTFLTKLLFPLIFYVGMTTGVIAMISSGEILAGFLASLMLLIFGVLIYFGLLRLKVVYIDDQFIYISNYFKKIKVPISEMSNVNETWMLNYHPIWITFKNETEFGRVIMFMPKMNVLSTFSTHPITEQLRNLIRNKKNG